MKTAIVHEWLSTYGGSEIVTETIMQLYPQAPLYCLIYDKDKMPGRFKAYDIRTTWIQHMPLGIRKYPYYLPLMPRAYESLDLTEYDLVISSSTACAKGVITRPDACHICYCHTTMRYAWDMYYSYHRSLSQPQRSIMAWWMHRIRQWDRLAADRVDHFIANSAYVAKRIEKYYRREATVIHPPVNISRFAEKLPAPEKVPENYFLVVSRLVPYKRIDIAVEAFNRNGLPLVIIGDGPELKKLKRLAGPTIHFRGSLPDQEVTRHYQHCWALIFPGEEDFGITPVEAQAAGRPVIAYGRGGALETVIQNTTGLFFSSQNAASLNEAVTAFQTRQKPWDGSAIRQHAAAFDTAVFTDQFHRLAETIMR